MCSCSTINNGGMSAAHCQSETLPICHGSPSKPTNNDMKSNLTASSFARFLKLSVLPFVAVCNVVLFQALAHHMWEVSATSNTSDISRVSKSEVVELAAVDSTDNLSEMDRYLIDFLSKSQFGRDKVRELLVHEFVSETSPDTDPQDKIENAVDALEIAEVDDEPVQIDGFPFLFVGSIGASLNEESLRKNKITHIINWSSSARCNVFPDINYFCVEGVRSGSKMIDFLDEAVEFIQNAHENGGNIMSHCWYGRNRSVTALIAYLMKYKGMLPKKANKIIKVNRPQAEPYRKPLMQYSEFLTKGHYHSSTGDNAPEYL